MTNEIDLKYERLKGSLQGYGKVAIGFSGGVDSTFLLRAARDTLGSSNVLSLTAVSPMFSPREKQDAALISASMQVQAENIDIQWDDISSFAHNPPDRCYLCKKLLFGRIIETAEAAGFVVVLDGSNADDDLDYRPGKKALTEYGVRSPLADAGLTKADIRELSKRLGLTTWEKPAFACLASRIPYGEPLTEEKLLAIQKVEEGLQDLGFTQMRVRHHGNVARIEVPPADRKLFFSEEVMDLVDQMAKQAGFTYAALDLGGYKMGSLNTPILPAGTGLKEDK